MTTIIIIIVIIIFLVTCFTILTINIYNNNIKFYY